MDSADLEKLLNTSHTDLDTATLRQAKQLDYYNQTVRGLSYSRQSLLRACPRKYEIYGKYNLKVRRESVTFAFGHAVGAGIQATLAGKSYNEVILAVLLEYDYPIDRCGEENEVRNKKSLWHAFSATDMFYKKYHGGAIPYLGDWEVAKFQKDGKTIDGVELTFVVDMGDGYTFEGHIDLVLFNPTLNRYLVLELKTSGGNVLHEMQFKNSSQPLGYGVVLDAIAGNLQATASFDVLYLVFRTKQVEFVPFQFTKTYEDKARWLMELLLDKDTQSMYETNEFYPTNGSNCFSFFRPCEVDEYCKMSDEQLSHLSQANSGSQMHEVNYRQMEEPTFMLDFDTLLERQQQLTELVQTGGEVDILLNVTNVSDNR